MLLQKLRQIKHICEQHTNCANCVFGNMEKKCQVKEMVSLLQKKPKKWNMKEVEGVCNDDSYCR